MALDFIEDIERAISAGIEYFAAPGIHINEWHISRSLDELKIKAQRTANSRKADCHVYKVANNLDAVEGDTFLVIRKILGTNHRGEPNLQWALVDTREAAEMLRDVSQGPSPFFAASPIETFKPTG